MDRDDEEWFSSEQVARRVGMGPERVRRQIVAGRLRARVFKTGSRSTYRVSAKVLREFLDQYGRYATAE